MRPGAALVGLALIAACDGPAPEGGGAAPPAVAPAPAQAQEDIATPEAARRQVVRYYALLANRRYEDAQKLWTTGLIGGEAPVMFAARFAGEERLRAEVGQPSTMTFRGPSAFITVPVIVRGVPGLAPDRPFELHRLVILRRSLDPRPPSQMGRWQITEVRDLEAEPDGVPRPIAY